ncbi:MAG TPA: non-homologous end-joining DNA ligase [Vicinamibacterales bacterium]|jgi:DNA ligase D-like protein (predicted polymerase)|nr:non-homologous end-joining DNA ligase [Vicinamibacterales bacterium]
MAEAAREIITVEGRDVAISNPEKVLFPEAGYTKLDLARYYLGVAEGALAGAGGRPNVLVRYPNGIDGDFFYQKRAPQSRPPWIEIVALQFPSGRTAEEVVPRDAAALVWMANLACLELHPHSIRADDLDHPDELRVDLDPVPGVTWPHVREVAQVVHGALDDFGLVGWPKTSGSRGLHVYVRIERRWTFDHVRRCALAFAREIERRAPALATSRWWKEERHGVFLDYNQNAKDRTIASAYSVRPTPDARVSAPLAWDEIAGCDPRDFTLKTMPSRVSAVGHRHADMDRHPCSLEPLLELSARQEREGLGDAPWPPHYRKQAGEPPRVQPSKARTGRIGWTGGTRRSPTRPLIEIGRAQKEADAQAGLERWKARHPDAASHLEPADVLVDRMRGRFHTWTRVRVNLQHVPENIRPPQEELDPDAAPNEWNEWTAGPKGGRRKSSAARTES